MNTAFVFHPGISTLSVNHEVYFLHSTDSDFIHTEELYLPALTFCIMHIHTVNLSRKKRCLIPTGTGTDFHDNVLIIIRILGKQQDFQLLFQLLHTFLGRGKLFL